MNIHPESINSTQPPELPHTSISVSPIFPVSHWYVVCYCFSWLSSDLVCNRFVMRSWRNWISCCAATVSFQRQAAWRTATARSISSCRPTSAAERWTASPSSQTCHTWHRWERLDSGQAVWQIQVFDIPGWDSKSLHIHIEENVWDDEKVA